MEVPTQSALVVQSNATLVHSPQPVQLNIADQPLHTIGGSGGVVRDFKSAEDDEELAFQMTLFMLAEAEKKAQIARVDEEYAFKEQLGADGNGKSLYVKYPNLDRIKGDDLFFPLGAVADKKHVVIQPGNAQSKQGNIQPQPKQSVTQPKQSVTQPIQPSASVQPKQAILHPQPITQPTQQPITQPRQLPITQSTAPNSVKTAIEAAGMNIRKGDTSMLYGQSTTVQHRTPYQHRDEYSLFSERAPLISMSQYAQQQPTTLSTLSNLSTISTTVDNTTNIDTNNPVTNQHKPLSISAQPFVPKSYNPH